MNYPNFIDFQSTFKKSRPFYIANDSINMDKTSWTYSILFQGKSRVLLLEGNVEIPSRAEQELVNVLSQLAQSISFCGCPESAFQKKIIYILTLLMLKSCQFLKTLIRFCIYFFVQGSGPAKRSDP